MILPQMFSLCISSVITAKYRFKFFKLNFISNSNHRLKASLHTLVSYLSFLLVQGIFYIIPALSLNSLMFMITAVFLPHQGLL